MPLSTGSRLGPYEILSAIGAGGMGEVYRARDTKLGRDVAIKVLPDAFARDFARMSRFGREAKLLASLNHPNIASIYGLEDSGSTRALVMELAEGPTLADRIKQGPIPIDEALPIARQIADALEYAHEKGVIHRDLKPANIKVAADDTVKILDFGLAKAMEANATPEGGQDFTDFVHRIENLLEAGTTFPEIAKSPTLSEMATMQGVLLGTAAYMPPEQAKAKPVDRRADIWAFGCVLYEMLTGKTAFHGDTMTDTLASVIRAEPDWSQLPPKTPMRVRVLLQRCLQKDVRQRLQAMGDARISLEEVLSGAPEGTPSPAVASPAKQWRWWLASGIAGALILAAAASLTTWNLKPSPPKPVMRFTITLPPGQHLAGLDQPALALSPDERQLAYVATTQGSGVQQIYLRAMDNTATRPIPGTEGATNPFFSPDGQWLGFFVGAKLMKIFVNGGVAQTLGDVSPPTGATWGSQGTIVFGTLATSALQQIPDGGGVAQALNRSQAADSDNWPEFLPGSRAVVFVANAPPAIAVQPIETSERRDLIQGQIGIMPHYTPSGHLIYAVAGNLMAVPFDLKRLQVTGPAASVVQGVLQSPNFNRAAQYSVSPTGSLVYVPGGVRSIQSGLVWVRRNGTEHPVAAPARDYGEPRLSPDGQRVAVSVSESGSTQVYLYDFARDTLSRFTFEGARNVYPVWTPDGKRIAFASGEQSSLHISWQLADGSGRSERLTDVATEVPFSFSPDAQSLAFIYGGTDVADIRVLRMEGLKEQPFLQKTFGLDAPQFSPDGHWLAYASDDSGRREIYVQPYPGPGGKWQVSTDGGTEPVWNRNGRELFYRNGDKMMAVDISTQTGFAAGKPRQLFEGRYLMNAAGFARPNFDVSADGQRFLMLKPVEREQAAPTQINVVLNWTEELKRLVPTGK